MSGLPSRLSAIKSRISEVAIACGRSPETVRLVAVSKTHPAETIREAYEEGQTVFGENRVQELLSKAPELPGTIEWHLIGHLQKNKIRKVLPYCALIHGVDSLELAQDIDRIAAEIGLFPRVLLEVNVAGEASKFGFSPDKLEACWEQLLTLPRLQVDGLMTIAPICEKPEEVRPFFAALRNLKESLEVKGGAPLAELSMGMSGDFEVAIAEGATLVRIGTAIFGSRPKKTEQD